MTTERLKQHIEDLEKRRIALFFEVQNITSQLNTRIYIYYLIVSIIALFILLANHLAISKNSTLTLYSNLFAFFSLIISLTQYIHTLNNTSGNPYKNILSIYKNYDDEYYILKKLNAGEVEESLVKQFYINKSEELIRYKFHIIKPDWIMWLTMLLLVGAILFLILT